MHMYVSYQQKYCDLRAEVENSASHRALHIDMTHLASPYWYYQQEPVFIVFLVRVETNFGNGA